MDLVDQIGVHRTHCCVLHGCKYRDPKCPVESGDIEQDFICEDCEDDGIESVEDIKRLITNEIDTCPHCGHILR